MTTDQELDSEVYTVFSEFWNHKFYLREVQFYLKAKVGLSVGALLSFNSTEASMLDEVKHAFPVSVFLNVSIM